MKQLVIITLNIWILIFASSFKGDTSEIFEHKAFQEGEYLRFKAHYGWFNAGEATLNVGKNVITINGKKCYHLKAFGRTTGVVDALYNVRDRYESYVDIKTLLPVKHIRDIQEGSYKRYNELEFDRSANKIKSLRKGEIEAPKNIHDIVSAVYYARTTAFENIKKGDKVKINTYFEDNMFPIIIKFLGKEKVKTSIGKINCLKFIPLVQEGRVFKDEEDVVVWVSDDKNHVPVRIESDLVVGAFQFDLVEYSGLHYALNKVK